MGEISISPLDLSSEEEERQIELEKQYDLIAENYKEGISQERYMVYVCDPSVLRVIGDPSGLDVLDFGCGEGYTSRILKQLGAKEVVGFDISEKMIDLALEAEEKERFGIDYFVHDARNLPEMDQFDLVVAKFVFHYSHNSGEIREMANSAYINLKKGGRLIALVPNFVECLQSDPKYDFTSEAKKVPVQEGDKIKASVYSNGELACSFDNFAWKLETYDKALRDVGFSEVKWHPLSVSSEGKEKYGEEFWHDLITSNIFAIVEATK